MEISQPNLRKNKKDPRVVIIGAGIGGLTAAALLVKAGYLVTVLEAGVYPGGSAGTFFHQGYLFDAGATLAGGFNPGGPHTRIAEMLNLEWPVYPVDPAWTVHLPERSIVQHTSHDLWLEERNHHFPQAETFWQRQQALAKTAWEISSKPFPWPPLRSRDWITFLRRIDLQLIKSSPFLFRKVEDLYPPVVSKEFKVFVDAQLMISAQTTANYANAFYGSAALDLPRRGVNSVFKGIGSLSDTLVDWIRRNGGEIIYRQEVNSITVIDKTARRLTTNKALDIEFDLLIANLTPHALLELLKEQTPTYLNKITRNRIPKWGTYMVYLGLENKSLPELTGDHHQVIRDINQPLGETNSIFISLSDQNDLSRAPAGMRAATISTHTNIQTWLDLANHPKDDYQRLKERYYERVLETAELAIPGIRKGIRFNMAGTPKTFEFFTHRPNGMAGGFPQTSLFDVLPPKTGLKNVWMVGDSIFPGQSTAGVTLGAIRVTAEVLAASSKQY